MTDLRVLHADGSVEGAVLHMEEGVTVIPRDLDIVRVAGDDYAVMENGTFFVKVGDKLRVTVTVVELAVEEEPDEVPSE